MTDAVEKLTGIMRDCGKSRQVKGGLGHLDYEEHLNAAQAILDEIRKDPLAYIPVKELEWEGIYSKVVFGAYYQILVSRSGKSYCLQFIDRDGSITLGYHPTLEAAQAAAQAHFNNQVRSMLG